MPCKTIGQCEGGLSGFSQGQDLTFGTSKNVVVNDISSLVALPGLGKALPLTATFVTCYEALGGLAGRIEGLELSLLRSITCHPKGPKGADAGGVRVTTGHHGGRSALWLLQGGTRLITPGS
jgi:hypothetical protein